MTEEEMRKVIDAAEVLDGQAEQDALEAAAMIAERTASLPGMDKATAISIATSIRVVAYQAKGR